MTILVVGGGKMGLSHLAISRWLASPDEVAVCDANWVTRFIYRKLNFRTYKSLDAALDDPTVNIKGVIVSTPTPSHFTIANKVIERSIPCFIEKPLTLSSKRSLALKTLAEERGVYVQVGFVLRYISTFARLRELVHSRVLGEVRSYQAQMNGNVVTKPDNTGWRTNFAAGGGCLNEYGPHIIDLCRFIFGEVSSVEGAVKGHVHSTRADDQIAFTWRHAPGILGEVKLDWCDISKRKSVIHFTVEFEHARVVADNSALHFTFSDPSPLNAEARDRIASLPKPPKVGFYLRGEEYSMQLEDFLGKCLSRKCRIDPEFGIGSQALLEDGLAVDQLIESISKISGLA